MIDISVICLCMNEGIVLIFSFSSRPKKKIPFEQVVLSPTEQADLMPTERNITTSEPDQIHESEQYQTAKDSVVAGMDAGNPTEAEADTDHVVTSTTKADMNEIETDITMEMSDL